MVASSLSSQALLGLALFAGADAFMNPGGTLLSSSRSSARSGIPAPLIPSRPDLHHIQAARFPFLFAPPIRVRGTATASIR